MLYKSVHYGVTLTPISEVVRTQQQQQQQQPCQKNFSSSHFVSDSPPIFTLNSTTISDTDFSTEIASPDSAAILGSYGNNNNSGSNSNNSSSDSDKLNSSNNATFTNNNNNNNGNNASKNLSNTNLLDRTMNVSTLLRSVGLEQYVEAFEEQNLDLEQFLNIRTEDFQRLGVTKAKHQQKLLDLLSELNGAEI
ncbi:PREDICTED: nuclear transcription factor Y subunit gamma-like [Rhagoletis zephyria]|uniref:nuclear transcription factor Y subunit gamma-like n=1 Tax=Rhagoletis zephyria TaxID=28612 RepID=UPI00081130B6|nr:PREDICTED: nuclear transcription factor Y subunit gamma-like [Rhagoletis zephyria]